MKFDIDIDFKTDFDPLTIFNWTKASIYKDEKLTPHPCGIYPQHISKDPITKLSAIPYDVADNLGFFKIDMLHLSAYNHFQSRQEMLDLLEKEPDWNLLLMKSNVEKLFQLSKHFDIILKTRPKSIDDIADLMALIRPGKIGLLDLYLAQKEFVKKVLYSQTDKFSFKKSHAYSYAQIVILQLHLIEMNIL
jgi:DNA polymerase III alpha subunit